MPITIAEPTASIRKHFFNFSRVSCAATKLRSPLSMHLLFSRGSVVDVSIVFFLFCQARVWLWADPRPDQRCLHPGHPLCGLAVQALLQRAAQPPAHLPALREVLRKQSLSGTQHCTTISCFCYYYLPVQSNIILHCPTCNNVYY